MFGTPAQSRLSRPRSERKSRRRMDRYHARMVIRAASFVTLLLLGQTPVPPPPAPPPPAVYEDEYVRYDLLAPDSSRFRVRVDASVVTAGARVFVLPTDRQSLP